MNSNRNYHSSAFISLIKIEFMPEENENPPIFRTWRKWYALVIIMLLLEIFFFVFVTKNFA